jgi:hypothetical protein
MCGRLILCAVFSSHDPECPCGGSHDPEVLCVVVVTQSVYGSRDPGRAYGSRDSEGLW